MGVIEFFLFCVIVVLLGWAAVWAIGYFAPGHPVIIDKIIWGVVILVVLVLLFQSLGLSGYDPKIPRLR